MTSRALIMGINNYDFISDLRGCHNDVENISELLIDVYGFEIDNVVKLLDQDVNKSNLKENFRSLIQLSIPGDKLVLHFSGHGTYIKSDNDDEPVDELICLHDMKFDNSDTYMTDDEIGDLLNEVPNGVTLTVILDCCHSQTGTRAIRQDGSDSKRATCRSSLKVTADSTRSAFNTYARFVIPPSEYAPTHQELERHRRKKARRRSIAPMNHLLLASAEDDQTAADAYIADDYNGAFTYYLCEAAAEVGPETSAQAIFECTVKKIKAIPYSQNPQIEGVGKNESLFIGGSANSPSSEVASSSTGSDRSATALYQAMLQAANQFFEGNKEVANPVDSARTSSDVWVSVHGISQHLANYSDRWYEAQKPHLTTPLARQEVVWSHHVNPRDLPEMDLSDNEIEILKAELRATLEERGYDEAEADADTQNRDLARGDGLSIDDFIRYMASRETREKIIGEFTEVIKPLLKAGRHIHLVSHSWGTVVAYEGLRQIESEDSNLPGRVANFFVVGSALSIGTVRRNLFSRVNDGRKPYFVDHWYNLDAKRDVVGGKLSRKFKVDKQFLDLEPVGCSFFDFACAHSSYFDAGNLATNRDIFAARINQTLATRSTVDEAASPTDSAFELFHAQVRGLQEQIDDLLETSFSSVQSIAPKRSVSRDESNRNPRLAIVVGHTSTSRGAMAAPPIAQSEYQWNSKLAEIIQRKGERDSVNVKVFFRDRVGIAGAYKSVAEWGADASIELHFNAFNKSVRGTETLYGTACPESESWAQTVQDNMVSELNRSGRQNRGLRVCPPWPRGSSSVNALVDIPTCLIEPFFGDSAADAELGENRKEQLAEGLVDTFLDFVS